MKRRSQRANKDYTKVEKNTEPCGITGRRRGWAFEGLIFVDSSLGRVNQERLKSKKKEINNT